MTNKNHQLLQETIEVPLFLLLIQQGRTTGHLGFQGHLAKFDYHRTVTFNSKEAVGNGVPEICSVLTGKALFSIGFLASTMKIAFNGFYFLNMPTSLSLAMTSNVFCWVHQRGLLGTKLEQKQWSYWNLLDHWVCPPPTLPRNFCQSKGKMYNASWEENITITLVSRLLDSKRHQSSALHHPLGVCGSHPRETQCNAYTFHSKQYMRKNTLAEMDRNISECRLPSSHFIQSSGQPRLVVAWKASVTMNKLWNQSNKQILRGKSEQKCSPWGPCAWRINRLTTSYSILPSLLSSPNTFQNWIAVGRT